MGYIANVLDKFINDMKLVDTYLGLKCRVHITEVKTCWSSKVKSHMCVRPTTLYVSYTFYSDFSYFCSIFVLFLLQFSQFCSNFCANFISFSFFPFDKLNGNIYYVFTTCQKEENQRKRDQIVAAGDDSWSPTCRWGRQSDG